jgi:hypothetical protein
MEDGDGTPSRWNTLRALRVLDWFAQGGQAGRIIQPGRTGGGGPPGAEWPRFASYRA